MSSVLDHRKYWEIKSGSITVFIKGRDFEPKEMFEQLDAQELGFA